jgi:alkylhydroperoxidase/carboxymuconolactone decarboxylase family protein YurZ
VSEHPWRSGVLSTRFAELVCIALSAVCTNLDSDATRRHIRAALAAGATREEIVFVVKCATVVSVHALSVAAPILVEEAGEAVPPNNSSTPTPACDAMKAAGRWNTAWDTFAGLDAEWTDRFMAVGIGIYGSEIFSPKEIELLSVALDASVTHLYAPGIRRHIAGARDAGASVAEIMAVLQLCVSQGVQAANLAIPILDEELARQS